MDSRNFTAVASPWRERSDRPPSRGPGDHPGRRAANHPGCRTPAVNPPGKPAQPTWYPSSPRQSYRQTKFHLHREEHIPCRISCAARTHLPPRAGVPCGGNTARDRSGSRL